MPRPKNQLPTYKLHKTTGLARCWVGGKWVSLGAFGSPESRTAFARILAELAVAPAPVVVAAPAAVRTIDQVILAFWGHAEQHYRRADGTPTNQVVEYKSTLKPLHRLYGSTAAAEFGPLALKAVRAEMVRLDWCRNQVNSRIGKIKHLFKWAASEQLVPVAVFTALATVAGLQAGRTAARETEPIGPVAASAVDATLPFLPAAVRGLAQFQRFTGCRPGEACALRACDVERADGVWLYRPEQHKGRHKGKPRIIPIGPRAQKLLTPLMNVDARACLFDPRAVRACAGECYTTHSYTNAIRRGAMLAGVAHWHPNQLRHLFATEVRKAHGLEAAQVLLGHARADVTQIYAEKNLALATQVARVVG